jgi:hypothetical protein
MSDTYLFEKEGRDPDIERLEGLLSVYRIEPLPPSLNRAKREVVKKGSLFRLRFSYALITAALAVVVVSFAILIGFLNQKGRDVGTLRSFEEMPFKPDQNISAASIADVNELPEPPAEKQRSAAERQPILTKVRSVKFRKQTAKGQFAKVKLTPEEKYAYQQVLVALWITGSKLKVVQDTINGVNDEKGISTNEKR